MFDRIFSKSHSASSQQLLQSIRESLDVMETVSDSKLQENAEAIRGELATGLRADAPSLMVSRIAVAGEALRRSHGIRLYDVQLLAVVALIQGRIAQMQTGEGKTFAGIVAAACLGMSGRGVHLATPNQYLAERDYRTALPVVSLLNMTAGLLADRSDSTAKTQAYDCDITYGTGHEFGFDYLRDQLVLRENQKMRPGAGLLQRLRQDSASGRSTMQRGLRFAIVDEADSVLIDDAGSPLVLSRTLQNAAPDAAAHRTAMALVDHLCPQLHYESDASTASVVLTAEGIRRAHADDVAIPVSQLIRPWTDYVQQALRARLLFRRNVHYVIEDQQVRIVDETTGRIFSDRSWQDGLHQAIEVREGLPVTAEKEPAAQITRQRFFRLYEHLCGMTGTATGCEEEFAEVYGRSVEVIPLRVTSKRCISAPRFFADSETKWQAIAEEIEKMMSQGRSILIGTRSIDDSEILSGLLKSKQIIHQLLNGMQNADEASIVSRAGLPEAVTIATNLAGRGTDIELHPAVRDRGGLHVIVAECQSSERMDRQLTGRCARQGDPGSSSVFVSADDALLRLYGPWLADAIRREANTGGEARMDFSPQLFRIQKAAEKQQRRSRLQLLARDKHRDQLLGNQRPNR